MPPTLKFSKNFEIFNQANVLITGGLGFIGSTLAIRLVEFGAKVTLLDAMIPEYGGNLFNINPIKDKIRINFSNICDQHSIRSLVSNQDYVFHLAGQVSHVKSLSDPYLDIEFNIKGTTVLMEELRRLNPNAKVIFSGTRGQYGHAVNLPVNEEAPTKPLGIYEISNQTAENIILLYHDRYDIRSVVLRLTNIYGPRAQMKHSQYGVVNWFIRLAMEDKTIPIFGDGNILRDFLYIDDCVEALLLSAINTQAEGETFNVGVNKPIKFRELADMIVKITGSGRWAFAPFTPERKAQEPGDFYSDITKIKKTMGWKPRIPLKMGLQKTVEYYRKYKDFYW